MRLPAGGPPGVASSGFPPAIAIAGGGLIGLSIAWRLAQAGCSVTVFDQGAIGAEASWAGAGMLAPGGECEEASPFTTLALQSRALYPAFIRELEEASGLAIDYQENGALELAYSSDEWSALRARAECQGRLGIASKPVPLERVHAFWPRVETHKLTGALFYPGDAAVNPRELVAALAAATRVLGVTFRQETPVERVTISDQGPQVSSSSGVTDHFDAVVIAAGAWSQAISVDGVPALPSSEPVKGHLIGYQQPEQTCNTIVRHGHTYLLQRSNGLMIAGASVERVGFDRSIDATVVASLAQEAGRIFPHLAETTPTEAWIGFRPGSQQLQIGAWHSPRLFLAYGHFRNGILLAPATAAQVAQGVLEAILPRKEFRAS